MVLPQLNVIDHLRVIRYLLSVKSNDDDAQKKSGKPIIRLGHLLEKLKKDEANSESDFNYNLIHELYQLNSNCKSALHQQLILERLLTISNNEKRISFTALNDDIKKNLDLNISEEILRREVELLILRNLISYRIEETTIVF